MLTSSVLISVQSQVQCWKEAGYTFVISYNQPNQIARISGTCCYFPTVGTDYEIAATISRLRDNGMLNVQVEKL